MKKLLQKLLGATECLHPNDEQSHYQARVGKYIQTIRRCGKCGRTWMVSKRLITNKDK